MPYSPTLLPAMIEAVADAVEQNAEEVTTLDQAIGDGDHVTNLQRGIAALVAQKAELAKMDWPEAWQKIAMILMSAVGGASGSLYGTFFMAVAKAVGDQALSLKSFAEAFSQGVEAVKQRGKSDAGEKTLLDVLIPVADKLRQGATKIAPLSELLKEIDGTARTSTEATRDMLATKGRASFLGERSRGHIDPGARTSQLMISAVVAVLAENSASPT